MAQAVAKERLEHLEALLGRLEEAGDDAALEAVAVLVDVYGEALARVMDRAPQAFEALASDELVGHLMLLHGLHPVALEERVARALEEVRPALGTHGGGVELLGVHEGVVRLRLEGNCSGCPSSRVTLRHSVEEAIRRAAPDVLAIEAEDGEPPAQPLGLELPLACPAPVGASLPVVS